MAIQLREQRIKPFLRWAGGKSWFHDNLSRLLKGNNFTGYYEPFLGGGSVFLSLDLREIPTTLADANRELIDTYIAVRDSPKKIIKYLSSYTNTAEFYYSLRAQEPADKYEKAARFIYLNHTSFNGLYRVNSNGKYNVPYGRRKFNTEIFESIREAGKALKGVHLLSGDFAKRIKVIREGTLVFLDPPYTVSNNNGFIAYNQKLFSLEDQERLAEYIGYIKKQGAYFILTNAAHKEIKNIFKDTGRCIEVQRQNSIGGRNARRGITSEYVFTNIEPSED